MQYFQEDELSEAEEDDEEGDEDGEERKVGSSSSGGGVKLQTMTGGMRQGKDQPNSASTQHQTQYLKTKSISEGEGSKSEEGSGVASLQ